METPYTEDDCDSEAVFAVGDRPPWTQRETASDVRDTHVTPDVCPGSPDGV